MNSIKVTAVGFEILNGGLRIVDTDSQNIAAIVKMAPGHAGNDPYLGVNIFRFANAPKSHSVLNNLKKRIKLNLKREKVTVHKLNMGGFPNIELDASYDDN